MEFVKGQRETHTERDRDSERQRHTHRNTERSTEKQRDTETEEGRRDGEGVKLALLRGRL